MLTARRRAHGAQAGGRETRTSTKAAVGMRGPRARSSRGHVRCAVTFWRRRVCVQLRLLELAAEVLEPDASTTAESVIVACVEAACRQEHGEYRQLHFLFALEALGAAFDCGVRACVRACMPACMRACMHACVCAHCSGSGELGAAGVRARRKSPRRLCPAGVKGCGRLL